MTINSETSTIRNVNINDLETITAIDEECFGEENAFSKEEFEGLIRMSEESDDIFKVLEIYNSIIGFISGTYEYSKVLTISTINIVDEYRRLDFGSLLLRKFIDEANCIENVEFIDLYVSTANYPAIELYKQFGFHIVSVEKDYYEKDENAYLFVKGLKEPM